VVPECVLPCEDEGAECDCSDASDVTEVMADVIAECYDAGGRSWAFLVDQCDLSEDELAVIAVDSASTATAFGVVLGVLIATLLRV